MEHLYWAWLISIPGIGAKKCLQLIEHFGSARSVFECAPQARGLLSAESYRALVSGSTQAYLEAIQEKLESKQIRVITRFEREYPASLAQIHDPPCALFVRGHLTDIDHSIGMVGSRHCTAYGRERAHAIARELGAWGVCIVSGLARGIDTCAHTGCLEGRGRTIAVMGCGVDVVYPPENAPLIDRILDQGGAVISEYPPGMPPLPIHFPARNRIIAGIAQGLLLIEADKGSGAMITVDFAMEEGREVLALPGNVTSRLSTCPNELIRDGAALIRNATDVCQVLGWEAGSSREAKRAAMRLNAQEKRIVELVQDEPISFELLHQQTGLPPSALNSLLTTMCLSGIMKQLPGRVFCLAHEG